MVSFSENYVFVVGALKQQTRSLYALPTARQFSRKTAELKAAMQYTLHNFLAKFEPVILSLS